MEKRINVGITIGDANGIGPEIIIKALSDKRIIELCNPIVYGNRSVLNQSIKDLQLGEFKLQQIDHPTKANGKSAALISLDSELKNAEYGMATKSSALCAYDALERALQDLLAKDIDCLVTGPINKDNIQHTAFDFAGHTEYLENKDGKTESLMLMINEHCRIGLVTNHISVNEVSNLVKTDLILKKLSLLNKTLRNDFNIRKPKIAVLGLNPHSGDNGLIGREDEKEILPAIQQSKTIGIMAFGPYPADGFFGSGSYKEFDGILAMYHDQGLIPAKMLSSGVGINYTAGLSFVRTSPDHGTAMDIAGKGIANESSIRSAIYKAIEISRTRLRNEELIKNKLETSKNRA